MHRYENWQKIRGEQFEAERWAAKLGAKSHATAPHVGTISSASGSFCIHYQPSDGATNYHESPKCFNAALIDALTRNAKMLIDSTLEIMRARTAAALIACEDELAQMNTELIKAKSAA